MKLSIAAAIVTMSTTVNARLHPDESKSNKNRELQWGPSKNMVERSLVSPAITAIQGDIVLLEAEDDILHDQIATANTAIATANAEITVLQDDVISLEAANVTLNDQIATADTAIATANTEITELQDDVISLEAANVTLNDQIATADNAIDTANANIAALTSRLEAAEATIIAAVATINELSALVRALTQSPSASPTAAPVTPAPVVPVTQRIVFVTSDSYTGGAIGGLAGADVKCQTLANAAPGVSGIFKAWLSNSTSWPAKDFVKSGGPFVTTTGDIVANDWQDLITDDGSGFFLNNTIAFDEEGIPAPAFATVWTGTSEIGMPFSNGEDFCNDWTSTSGDAFVGYSSFTNSLWTAVETAPCGNTLRLYCFEQ